jgi:hypothetical protein
MSKQRIYCNSCKSETWHELVAQYTHERYEYFWGYSQRLESETFKCCGCEDITFRLTKHPFDFQDPNDDPDQFVYPDRSYKFRERKFYLELPRHINLLYNETISAHNNKLLVLSTVGVRSLVEAVVADKIDPTKYKNNLESKINALAAHFQPSVINTLHDFRIMGNKAAHEIESPESLNIHHALYVVEGMLEFFYGIESHARLFDDHKKKPEKTKPDRVDSAFLPPD